MQKNSRLNILAVAIILFGLALIGKLFILQVINHNFYQELAAGQHGIHKTLLPERGEIFIKDRFYDKNSYTQAQLFPLAVNRTWPMLYAIPNKIEKKEQVINQLDPLIELEKSEIARRINKKDDPYEPLAYQLSEEVVQKIKELNIEGLKFSEEILRYYPADTLASHILGFVGFSDNKRIGQYGVEGYYNQELEGAQGFLQGEKDTRGRLIAVAKNYLKPAKDGSDLILTIDPNVQFFVEEKLKEIVERLGAEGGTIIVEDPNTGAIKAMANLPEFNPNKYYEQESMDSFLNPAISSLFEPGSIFKAITMAIALDQKLITSNTTYEDNGFVKVDGHIIKNSHSGSEGIQTMTQVLEKSLNTGAVFVGELIPKKDFKKYLEKFGFSEQTGINLVGEVKGNLSNLNTNRDIEFATASFGQGIAITPIQLITALSAIANNGKMIRPRIIEKIGDQLTKVEITGNPISETTAEELTKMMVSVVENGYGSKAKVNGYFIAGKTGTAQVPSKEKREYSDKTIHCFGGFFPAFDPKFVMIIKLDNPKSINFAADSVVPVFGDIAEYILNYYEIPPSR